MQHLPKTEILDEAELWPRANNHLLFVFPQHTRLFLDHVLRRRPGRQRDGPQPLARGGLLNGCRDLDDLRRLHYRPAGAARAKQTQARQQCECSHRPDH